MEGINLSQPLVNSAVDSEYKLLPNVDAKYGPWASTAAAIAGIPANARAVGLTIGVMSGTKIIEYWFEAGTADSNLVQKQSGGGSSTGGYTLHIGNNIIEDTNTNLNSLFPSAAVKDMVIDATLGGLYLKYQDGKWAKFNGTILTDSAPTVTEIQSVRMMTMK